MEKIYARGQWRCKSMGFHIYSEIVLLFIDFFATGVSQIKSSLFMPLNKTHNIQN